jgi:phosphoribosyl-AMP cyclohydrolase
LKVLELRTDCDQDVVWLRVAVEGDGLACHTGRRSCFYRSLPLGTAPNETLPLAWSNDSPKA